MGSKCVFEKVNQRLSFLFNMDKTIIFSINNDISAILPLCQS